MRIMAWSPSACDVADRVGLAHRRRQRDRRRVELHAERIGGDDVDVGQPARCRCWPASAWRPSSTWRDVGERQRSLRRRQAVDDVALRAVRRVVAGLRIVTWPLPLTRIASGMLPPGSTVDVGRVAGQLDEHRVGREAGLHGRPLVEARIEAAVQADDRRILALVDVDVRERRSGLKASSIQRSWKLPRPCELRISTSLVTSSPWKPPRASLLIEYDEPPMSCGKLRPFAELLGVHVDDRVARHHQRVGVGDVVQMRDAVRYGRRGCRRTSRPGCRCVQAVVAVDDPGWRCGCRASCSACRWLDRLSTIRQNSGKSSASRLPLTVVSLVLMPSLLGKSRRMYGCTLPDVAVGHLGEHVDRLDRAVEIRPQAACGTPRGRSS